MLIGEAGNFIIIRIVIRPFSGDNQEEDVRSGLMRLDEEPEALGMITDGPATKRWLGEVLCRCRALLLHFRRRLQSAWEVYRFWDCCKLTISRKHIPGCRRS